MGAYPVQVIEQMSNIIRSVEHSTLIKLPLESPFIRSNRYVTNSICYHAAQMANEMNAKVISTLTNSGYTAFQISAYRPKSHILVFTSNRRILTQLSLLWGVTTFYYDRFVSTDETIEDVNHIANQKGYVNMGDIMVSLAAMPIQGKGMVNTLRVTEIDSCAI
ncbi:Pyruvate kinase (fragment) [Capnocytophaga canimorsus]